MNKQLIFLTLMTVCIFSCRKNMEDVIEEYPKTPPKKLIETNISGQVLDKYFQPVSGAKISIDDKMVYTDDNGYYIFKKVQLDEYQDYIKIDHPDFFTYYQTFESFPGELAFRSSILEESVFTNSFDSEKNNNFKYNNQFDIQIDKQSLNWPNGNLFIGKFKMAPKFIQHENTQDKQVGFLIYDEKGTRLILKADEMLGFEIQDVKTGTSLILNKEITVNFSSTKIINSNDKVYFFDELSKNWLSENEIIYKNNNIQFKTKNSKNFIIGTTQTFVVAQGKSGPPFSKSFVKFESATNEEKLHMTRSTLEGSYKTFLFQNQNQNIALLNECDEKKDIIKLTTHAFPIQLDYNFQNNSELNLNGQILNCDTATNKSSYVLAKEGNQQLIFPVNENLDFNLHFSLCSNSTLDIFAYNQQTKQKSDVLTLNANNILPVNLKLCQSKILSLAKFNINDLDTIYKGCRVKIIKSNTTSNILYIFEYGNNNNFSDKIFLEKSIDVNNMEIWKLTQSSLINNTYTLKQIIDKPDIYEFLENGTKIMECDIPKILAIDELSRKTYYTKKVYFRAVVQ